MTNQTPDRADVPFGSSFEVGLLVAVLEVGEEGDVLTNEQIGEIIGMEVEPKEPDNVGYRREYRARVICERDRGIVWKRIPGERLIKCLGPIERADEVAATLRAARRRVVRSGRLHGTVNPEDLPEEMRSAHLARGHLLHATKLVLGKRTETAIAKQLEASEEPDQKTIVDLFLKRKRLK
jgi:hypothetical protein